jgi:imidazolonepropionase-like amidohydrolase
MSVTRYIVVGSLIDGSGEGVLRNVFLAVKDGVIAAIGQKADLPRNARITTDEFPNSIIVPPFVDCSVSLARSPAVDCMIREAAATTTGTLQKPDLVAQHINYCYSHGVLGVADNEDTARLEGLVREKMAMGSIIAIRTSGRFCRPRQGYVVPKANSFDFLRVEYSPSIDDAVPHESGFTRETLRNILQQRGEKKAVVVANGEQRVTEALEAGCDAIEQGYGMGEVNLRKMSERGILWIPSVNRAKNGLDSSGSGGEVSCRFSMRYVAPGKADPDAEGFWKRMLTGQLAQLRQARKLGVNTAVGTGAGSIGILHGESVVEEMKLFIKAGYSIAETIRCASENGARFFGMPNLGTLAVGRKAMFLIARGTVQQLPRKLAYLENIYVDGAPAPTVERKI